MAPVGSPRRRHVPASWFPAEVLARRLRHRPAGQYKQPSRVATNELATVLSLRHLFSFRLLETECSTCAHRRRYSRSLTACNGSSAFDGEPRAGGASVVGNVTAARVSVSWVHLEVRRNGELVAIPAPRQRALLGLLLVRANEPVPQDELIDELWGEDAPPTARASLQNQVHALRRILGPGCSSGRRPGTSCTSSRTRWTSRRASKGFVLEARGAGSRGNEPRGYARRCRTGADLHLVEFPDAPFAQHEINRLEEERLAALEGRIEAELELGGHAELVAELESLVARYPLRERLWAQLMLALYRAGQQADALATYRRAHQTFDRELGVDPERLPPRTAAGDPGSGRGARRWHPPDRVHARASCGRSCRSPRANARSRCTSTASR